VTWAWAGRAAASAASIRGRGVMDRKVRCHGRRAARSEPMRSRRAGRRGLQLEIFWSTARLMAGGALRGAGRTGGSAVALDGAGGHVVLPAAPPAA
jgi:hypothetical protein